MGGNGVLRAEHLGIHVLVTRSSNRYRSGHLVRLPAVDDDLAIATQSIASIAHT